MSWGQFMGVDGRPYGSYEVFHVSECDHEPLIEGWYWWACFPGCLPDGEPVGPFKTEAEARVDAETVL